MDKGLNLSYKVPGKWILAGEHTVLRGGEALVFPLKSCYLSFNYDSNATTDFNVEVTGKSSSDVQLIIWSALEKIFNELGIKRGDLKGRLTIHSEIFFGAGMGASASLSVGLSRFFKHIGLCSGDLYGFSKKIEDLFHGESSGVDVAVVLNQAPLLFKRHEKPIILAQAQLPILYLSHSGTKGVTRDCVSKVKALIESHPTLVEAIDNKMQSCVEGFKYELNQDHINLQSWSKWLELAHTCYQEWDLEPLAASQHIQQLKSSGALACKLTGSGGGGYVLSLWANHPSDDIIKKYQLISI